jgi:hypothetical protein
MRSQWIGMSVATVVALSCTFALAQRGGAGGANAGGGANIGGGANAGAGANVGGAGAGANLGAGTNAGANVGGQTNGGAGANIGAGAGANVGQPGARAGADIGTRENRREGRLDTGTNAGGDRGERWRFRMNNGRWWYWSPENRWSYYDNGNWTVYPAQGYTANYSPDTSAAVGDCTTPVGGYGALSNGSQNASSTNIDPRYRFDNGQWYYQTDNGWLTYNDGQWVEPRGPLPDFIVGGRGSELERGRGSDAQREAAREADLRGRVDAGKPNSDRQEGAEQGAARGRSETESTPGRTETREQPGRNEPAGSKKALNERSK